MSLSHIQQPKFSFRVVIILLLLLLACPKNEILISVPEDMDTMLGFDNSVELDEWTIMFYFAADNGENDGPSYFKAKERLESIGSSSKVNCIMLYDGIPSVGTVYPDSYVWYIRKGLGNSIVIPLNSINPLWTNEVNTADLNTIVDFVKFCILNYPAKRYALFLRSDAFFTTLCPDYTSDDDLTLGELKEALSRVTSSNQGKTLDILGLSSCNTAMVEWLYQLRSSVDYVVASEARSIGRYWRYEKWLEATVNDPGLMPYELAKYIVSNYLNSSEPGWLPKRSATVSAIDLRSFLHVVNATNELGLKLIAQVRTNRTSVQVARNYTEAMDGINRIDLYHFAQNIQHYASSPELKLVAQNLSASINRSIIASGHYTGEDTVVDNAHGLAICFPNSTADYQYVITSFRYIANLEFPSHTYWLEFLDNFFRSDGRVPISLFAVTEPSVIEPTRTATMTVKALDAFTHSPLSGVSISLKSLYGERTDLFSSPSGLTDEHGKFSTLLNTTKLPRSHEFWVEVQAVKKNGNYSKGHGFFRFIVNYSQPLSVSITADTKTMIPATRYWLRVHVTTENSPVPNANISMSSEFGGAFEPRTGYTDFNGRFSTFFTTPSRVAEQVTGSIKATVFSDGLAIATGTLSVILEASEKLDVKLRVEPVVLHSNDIAKIEILVVNRSSQTPLPGANVSLLVPNNVTDGRFEPATGVTKECGNFTTHYVAPVVTKSRRIMITAIATMPNYMEGKNTTYITVQPLNNTFIVVLNCTPAEVNAGSSATVHVYIEDANTYSTISGALVCFYVSAGTVAITRGYTNENGQLDTVFTAPAVTFYTVVKLAVTVSKQGYDQQTEHTEISIRPPHLFSIAIRISSHTIFSGETTMLKIFVFSDENVPVPETQVRLNTTQVSEEVKLTNSGGEVVFNFTAPTVTECTVITITINATKPGYVSAEKILQITVLPRDQEYKMNDMIWLAIASGCVVLGGIIFLYRRRKIKG